MAGETTQISGLASRYATALFELAAETDQLDAVASDLDAIQTLLDESDDLRRLVRSPVISRADQARAMDAVMTRAGLSELTRKFVGLLAHKRRLFALSSTIRAYLELLAAHRGEVRAEVRSATPLKPEHLTAIKEALRSIIGRDVAVDAEVDPALIGGLIVKIGSRMIDTSLRSKIDKLELAMKGIG